MTLENFSRSPFFLYLFLFTLSGMLKIPWYPSYKTTMNILIIDTRINHIMSFILIIMVHSYRGTAWNESGRPRMEFSADNLSVENKSDCNVKQ